MTDDLSFEELRAERHALRNAVLPHIDSVLFFKDPEHPWFRKESPQSEDEPAPPEKTVRHITTTASCLESLLDIPDHQDKARRAKAGLEETGRSFCEIALKATPAAWESEGSAVIYCRARALPAILRLSPSSLLEQHSEQIARHVVEVWDRVDPQNPERQGVAELERPRDQEVRGVAPEPEKPLKEGDLDERGREDNGGDNGVTTPETRSSGLLQEGRRGYPANAFHTYWALKLLAAYEGRGLLLPDSDMLKLKKSVAELWARRTLATQAALIEAERMRVDAHQLAWALTTDVVARGDRAVRPESEDDELYEAALAAFFSEQADDGRWRLYEPLFHYAQAGNAYCYTFETLAELLRPALRVREGRVWRDRLRPYARHLIKAWRYADATALETHPGRVGWCSGHHPHRTDPEAWATAAVFSYFQNLRCLIGYWTAEQAEKELRVRRAKWPTPDKAREVLGERGDTWPVGQKPTAGQQLASMFLHPLQATTVAHDTIDPDRELIEEARSAVLFGPPGGSKTTMTEALAGALDWRYVEIHASDFLSEGMDLVPSQADDIFNRLMELDRCTILFDEIDELIRGRHAHTSDPFGRFLTTSMLPKLAKLWEQRRVLFFVATNDIDAADPAIKRSQRFDASIFVTPPAFAKKHDELARLLSGSPPADLTEAAVNTALESKELREDPLGVFALLRWDQIAELAHGIETQTRDGTGNLEALKSVLSEMGKKLAELEWQVDSERHTGPDAPKEPYGLFRHFANAERRDHRNRSMLVLPGTCKPPDDWQVLTGSDYYVVLTPVVEAALSREGGTTVLDGDAWEASDEDGLFVFQARPSTTPEVVPDQA